MTGLPAEADGAQKPSNPEEGQFAPRVIIVAATVLYPTVPNAGHVRLPARRHGEWKFVNEPLLGEQAVDTQQRDKVD